MGHVLNVIRTLQSTMVGKTENRGGRERGKINAEDGGGVER